MVITRNTYEESDMMTLKIFQRWSHRPGNRPILVPHFVGAIDAYMYECTKSKDKSFNNVLNYIKQYVEYNICIIHIHMHTSTGKTEWSSCLAV